MMGVFFEMTRAAAQTVGTLDKTMVTVKSSQKIFTDVEISRLTGICLDHLHGVARSKHLGSVVRAAETAGQQAERWLFTNSDLSVLAVLFPRCNH